MENLEELRNRLLREERVQLMVRTRAYEIYQMRGGQPGWESHDWFQAEGEVLAFLIALESRLEDEKPAAETTRAVSAPKPPSVSEASAVGKAKTEKASAVGNAKPGKAPATKKPKARSASPPTTVKPTKKTSGKPAAPRKSESRSKANRTRKSSKEED